MLIFALLHDENENEKSGRERRQLLEDLELKGVNITRRSTPEDDEADLGQLPQREGQQRQQEPQQQQQQNPDSLFSGVQYVIDHATAFSSIISATFGAWLHARYGRRVRLKVGNIEIEAQTQKEVEQLLERAKNIERAHEPKRFHEP